MQLPRPTTLIIASAYINQGCYGLAAISLPLHLRDHGWSVSSISQLTYIATTTVALRIPIALLSDTVTLFGTRRQAYLIIFGVLSVCGWLMLSLAPPTFVAMLCALFAVYLGMVGIDVIADAMAADRSEGQEAHFYQSLAWGLKSGASVVIGLLSGWLAARIAAPVTFLSLTLPCLLCIAATSVLSEPPSRGHSSLHSNLWQAIKALRSPPSIALCFLLLLSQSSALYAIPLFFFARETLGLTPQSMGILMAVNGIGAALASIVYYRLSKKLKWQALLLTGCVSGVAAVLAFLLATSSASAFAVFFIAAFLARLSFMPLLAAAARCSGSVIVQGTMFAAFMTIYNLGEAVIGYFSATLFDGMSLNLLLLIAAATTTLMIPVSLFLWNVFDSEASVINPTITSSSSNDI